MQRFADAYQLTPIKKGQRLMLIPVAHHRFNYIHPFPDGNGRVSRLMSHAMAHWAGIGAHGLWSVSRGLARGLESRQEYARMMDLADTPRQGDYDGRGNLSEKALQEFTKWFLEVCLDQVEFMSAQFELHRLDSRYDRLVAGHDTLKPESSSLLKEALRSGEFERGQASRITGLPSRTAQRILQDVIAEGLLASDTPKGAVSLRFPASTLDMLFPRLYSEA
jgi:Fic family protein